MPRFNNLTPAQEEERRRKNAIACAQYFRDKASRIVGMKSNVSFRNMTVLEIDNWIADITSILKIKQFGK